MIKLETFKKQSKLLFNEIKEVDLLNNYCNLLQCQNTIAKSLGFQSFNEAIYDTYEKEGLTSFHKKNDNNLQHDFSSYKKPSFIDFKISYDNHEYNEHYNSKKLFIIDEENKSYYFNHFNEINSLSRTNNIFIQNINKFPELLQFNNKSPEKSIYFDIHRNSQTISNKYTIDPLNITLSSKDFCDKFFHPLISQWLHPFMVSIYQQNLIIDIFSFIHLFNLPFLISQKDKYSEINKYLDKLGITNAQSITAEQLQEHSSLCSTTVALSVLFNTYKGIFANISEKGCFQIFSNQVYNENISPVNKFFKICLNSDPIDDLAGQILLSAMTTYEYDISLNNKKENQFISYKRNYNNSIEDSNFYIIGANKSNTLLSYIEDKININFVFQTDDFISLKQWQRDSLIENSNSITILNKSENLMPFLPVSLKRLMFNTEKIPDNLRTEFKGKYIISTSKYNYKTVDLWLKKIS